MIWEFVPQRTVLIQRLFWNLWVLALFSNGTNFRFVSACYFLRLVDTSTIWIHDSLPMRPGPLSPALPASRLPGRSVFRLFPARRVPSAAWPLVLAG